MGYRVRNYLQLRDRIKATAVVVHSSDSNEIDYVFMVLDELSTSSSQWILDSACSHHVCYKERLLDSLESSKNTIHLRMDQAVRPKALG